MKRFKARQRDLLFILILGIFLITGCGGGGGEVTGHWIAPNPDTTAPTVTAVVPLRNATGVARNIKKITARFSKAMDPATLTTGTFTLACPAGTPVTGGGAVTYIDASRVASLPLPTATTLPANTICTATVTTGAKDLAANPLAENYTWIFTTGLLSDNTAPTVTLTVPADKDGSVAINTAITATFNEDMDPATIDGTTFTVVNTTLGGTAVAGAVTYAGKTATFTPTTPTTLPANTKFTATITTGATDLAGNALVEPVLLPKPNPWTFTTGAGLDITPPTVTLVNPVDLSTTVCNNKTISATFSEPMNELTITNATFTLATTAGVSVTGVVAYDALTYIATFNPTVDLPAGLINYTATIKGGAGGAADVAGNVLAVNKVWSFTTDNTTCLAPVAPGLLSPFGVASFDGLTDTGASKVNGNVVVDTGLTCSGTGGPMALGSANDFGNSCNAGANKITNNLGDLVITQVYPDTTSADAVMAELKVKWNSISPAGTPGATVLGCGTIGSLGDAGAGIGCSGNSTLPPGPYISATSSTIGVTGNLTLDAQGDADAVWVFQAPSALAVNVGSKIILAGGAKASNVWWFVGSSATLLTNTTFQGNILASASITMQNLATSCGRLLAGAEGGGAFVFDTNTVSVPGHANAPADCK